MNFIKTVRLKRPCEKNVIDLMIKNFDENSIFYNDNPDNAYKAWILMPYTNWGLQVEIDLPLGMEREKHPRYEMIISITPAKLLNPSLCLEEFSSKDKIKKACEKLKELVSLINEKSGVNILSGTYLWSVELRKTIYTPSDLYSEEIIAALKKSIIDKRYDGNDDFYIVSYQDDVIRFYNKAQMVIGVAYNPTRNLILSDSPLEITSLEGCGLLGFELNLWNKKLKEDYNNSEKGITCEKLAKILWKIKKGFNGFFERHFSKVFFSGAMVSREIMEALITDNFPNDPIRLKKMLNYSDNVSDKTTKERKKFTEVQIAKRRKWFAMIGLSPVSVCRECPYIPSLGDLLYDEIDKDLLMFAENTTSFDHWFWN